MNISDMSEMFAATNKCVNVYILGILQCSLSVHLRILSLACAQSVVWYHGVPQVTFLAMGFSPIGAKIANSASSCSA